MDGIKHCNSFLSIKAGPFRLPNPAVSPCAQGTYKALSKVDSVELARILGGDSTMSPTVSREGLMISAPPCARALIVELFDSFLRQSLSICTVSPGFRFYLTTIFEADAISACR